MAGKTIKLDIDTIYHKAANCPYYFRDQINGQHKTISLKTPNKIS